MGRGRWGGRSDEVPCGRAAPGIPDAGSRILLETDAAAARVLESGDTSAGSGYRRSPHRGRGAAGRSRGRLRPRPLSYRAHVRRVHHVLRAVLLVGLAAACCPPLKTSYVTPAETLGTWQSHLCEGDVQGEYRCLSRGLQGAMGGFETYFAARQKLLDDDPVTAFLVKRVDLPARAVEDAASADGLRHRMVFEESGQRFAIEFVVETLVTFRLADGTELPGRLDREMAYFLGRDRRQQWLTIPRPLLDDDEARAVRALLVEQQWKIDAIEGLSPHAPQVIE